MRLDGPCIADRTARGIRYREINLLRAILCHAHSQMGSQRNVAKAFSGACPVAGCLQSIPAIVIPGRMGLWVQRVKREPVLMVTASQYACLSAVAFVLTP